GDSVPSTERASRSEEPIVSEMHQIGEVAHAVGLSLRTIRYYDEAGLAIPSGRSGGGFRLYTDVDIERLRLIRNLKPLDLSIEQMRELRTIGDRRADPEAGPSERTALRDRLAAFAALADERCRRLRDHRDMAEGISRTLHAEAQASV